MMDDVNESVVIEHSELIDMRTHLTVAMLAASQLNRRTKGQPGAAHLQEYLDNSLRSLAEDVMRVDALVTQTDGDVPMIVEKSPRRIPKPVLWAIRAMGRGVSRFRTRASRRRFTRLTALYLTC